MFVIVTYDINVKRVGKAVKICRKYLNHVQMSVFEGTITESRLSKLKSELEGMINPEMDAVCIYRFESPNYAKKEQIGVIQTDSNVI